MIYSVPRLFHRELVCCKLWGRNLHIGKEIFTIWGRISPAVLIGLHVTMKRSMHGMIDIIVADVIIVTGP